MWVQVRILWNIVRNTKDAISKNTQDYKVLIEYKKIHLCVENWVFVVLKTLIHPLLFYLVFRYSAPCPLRFQRGNKNSFSRSRLEEISDNPYSNILLTILINIMDWNDSFCRNHALAGCHFIEFVLFILCFWIWISVGGWYCFRLWVLFGWFKSRFQLLFCWKITLITLMESGLK